MAAPQGTGMMDAWLHVNWGLVAALGGQEYYRDGGLPFDAEGPADGRPLCGIGWTADGPMLYPWSGSSRQCRHSLPRSKRGTNEFGKNNEEKTYLASAAKLPGGGCAAAGRGLV